MIDFSTDLASHSLVRTSESRRVILEEHSAAFKWLMASFLAINGGGMISLVDMKIGPDWRTAAGVSFWIGIVCALGIAWRGQVQARAGLEKLAKIEAFWATVVASGQLDTEELGSLEREMDSVKPGASRLFGWISLLAFSLGLGLANYGNQ